MIRAASCFCFAASDWSSSPSFHNGFAAADASSGTENEGSLILREGSAERDTNSLSDLKVFKDSPTPDRESLQMDDDVDAALQTSQASTQGQSAAHLCILCYLS